MWTGVYRAGRRATANKAHGHLPLCHRPAGMNPSMFSGFLPLLEVGSTWSHRWNKLRCLRQGSLRDPLRPQIDIPWGHHQLFLFLLDSQNSDNSQNGWKESNKPEPQTKAALRPSTTEFPPFTLCITAPKSSFNRIYMPKHTHTRPTPIQWNTSAHAWAQILLQQILF